MPNVTRSFRQGELLFDARPDRVDLRDREYMPKLESLPHEFPDPEAVKSLIPRYKATLILDQGSEGACTGFGLAALVNYLRFRRSIDAGETGDEVERVSARMLYHLARMYDEWPGEDYAGSSCRGAMKGWHRHGVCLESRWPYRNKRGDIVFMKPKDGWQDEAAGTPLGAYYRVNKNSIADMQSAIHEVGAIYASADVHDGWDIDEFARLPVIEIPKRLGETSCHAFAIVGYTLDGFIVQNSWGPEWGFGGFAVMQYRDWVERGMDAWVAVLGAPVALQRARRAAVDIAVNRTRSTVGLQDAAAGRASVTWSPAKAGSNYVYRDARAEPLSEGAAYEHSVVLGNNGRPINRFLDADTEADAMDEVVRSIPLERLGGSSAPRLLIYAHGGLNAEEASIRRVRIMAPYFRENDIHPIFITWRTGFLESLSGILQDALTPPEGPAGGIFGRLSEFFDRAKDKLAEAKNRSIEVACEHLLVKPVWTQMKQNAAAGERTGLAMIASGLRKLVDELGSLEIHLAGHSAGSIVHGHLLESLTAKGIPVATCTLFAPACTVRFALDHYGPKSRAVARGIFDPGELYVENLSDKRESADSVGVYGKSLLYLVSRALEDVHKMPLLGMEGAWRDIEGKRDLWYTDKKNGANPDVAEWQKFVPRLGKSEWLEAEHVSDGRNDIRAGHGSFDNDAAAIGRLIRRVRDARLKVEIESLGGF